MENIVEHYYQQAVRGLDESILSDYSKWYNYVEQLPEKLQVTYTLVLFHSQVENGGFHQYFFNAYGQFVFLTLKNLQIVHATTQFLLLSKALDAVNEEHYNQDIFRFMIINKEIARVAEFSDDLMAYLDRLDKEYYSSSKNVGEYLTEYLSGEK